MDMEELKKLTTLFGDKFKKTLADTIQARQHHSKLEIELCESLIGCLLKSDALKDKVFDMHENYFCVGSYGNFGVELSIEDKEVVSMLNDLLGLWKRATGCLWINLEYSTNKEDSDNSNCYINSGSIVLDSNGVILCQRREDAVRCGEKFGFKIVEDPKMMEA